MLSMQAGDVPSTAANVGTDPGGGVRPDGFHRQRHCQRRELKRDDSGVQPISARV